MSNPLEPYGQQPPGPSGGPPHQPGTYGGPPGTYGGPPGQPGAYGGPPGQPGGYGPPAQPPYGQSHAYGYGNGYGYGYGPPGGGPPADWGSRVGASLIDSLLLVVPLIPGYVLALVLNGGNDELGAGGGIALGAAYLGCFVVWLWNRVIRQGRTGQSVGKRVLGLRLLGESTGQAIGVGRTLGRELMAGIFNNICFLNCLWPLWDDKQQTWHDKVVSTIVVKL